MCGDVKIMNVCVFVYEYIISATGMAYVYL